ncbi:MAG: HU family DNA-binding protein [Syntrophales bacterium]|nr:HU family DNA-binding protein [Syntrophales bacterium]
MNKSDLINTLAQKEGLTEKRATDIVNLIFKKFTDTLANGDRVKIKGFGNFTVRNYDGYDGQNPRTKQEIKVAPKKLPFFKVGKELKERVNSVE